MKLLVHIIEDKQYVVINTRTGGKIVYEKDYLEGLDRFKITGLYVKNHKLHIESGYYDKCTNGKLTIINSLVEGKHIVGYMIYFPDIQRIECVTYKQTKEYITNPGINNGRLVESSTGNKYIVGKFGSSPAKFHKQVYMNYYKKRKKSAVKTEKPFEKIVRKELHILEMRSLPALTYKVYDGPKGVNQYNLKWWSIKNGEVEFAEKPNITKLNLAYYAESILYNGLPSSYSTSFIKSLGCFSECNISELMLGDSLRYIGREAFYGNKISSLTIPMNVDFIGKSCFENNLIEKLIFKKGKLNYLGPKAFKNNLLKEIVIPQTISDIGRECFANNKDLSKVVFEDGSYLKSLDDYVFQNCSFESIVMPKNVKKVSPLAFKGCNKLKKIVFYKECSFLKTIEYKTFLESMDSQIAVEFI